MSGIRRRPYFKGLLPVGVVTCTWAFQPRFWSSNLLHVSEKFGRVLARGCLAMGIIVEVQSGPYQYLHLSEVATIGKCP